VMKRLKERGFEVVIYEPSLNKADFFQSKVIYDLQKFKDMADIIITNRWSKDLEDVKEKVYTRDIYQRD
jgi:UDPglucose 6-dehydrogenase